ncbi:MAG: succinate--CoA ligase subunit alpha [Phycisphaeraceae bacterium]|nr:succinate--CoA ligase subunit alpha [Phycisphaeraceae bacterium]
MPVLVDASTRVICQGITGSAGATHTRGCFLYGTRLVGGVTPGKGGQKFDIDAKATVPIFDTVERAVKDTAAAATMIFVPPAFCADAILEAAAAGIKVICAITEGVPVQDMIRVRAVLDEMGPSGPALIGPNCPGVISPGPRTGSGESSDDPYTRGPGAGGCKIGIMPGYIHLHRSEKACTTRKAVGIVSRSGTLTYEAVWQCSNLGIAQSTCIGIGGDPVRGLNHIDCLRLFQDDPDTDGILMIGEIGGSDEEAAADYIRSHVKKPVAAFIAGRTAPPGKRMGHAGAIIEAGGADGKPRGTAQSKIDALQAAGVQVSLSPAEMGKAMAKALGI